MGIFGRIRGRGRPSLAELSKQEVVELQKVLPDPGDWLEKEGKLELLVQEMGRKCSREALAATIPTSRAFRAYAEGMVPILESLVESQPFKWLYWYKLGQFAEAARDYVKAIRAYEQSFQLRPSDPRSTYGLAGVYRSIAEGGYTIEEAEERGLMFARLLKAVPYLMEMVDTPVAKKALEELGLTVEEAAQRAMALYGQTLELGVRGDEVRHVEECLDAMAKEFAYIRVPGTWSKGS